MGTTISLRKDYNRTLAKQPRKSFGLSKSYLPDDLQQYPLAGTLSIPVPVRNSKSNKQTSASPNELPSSELNQISIQHNPTPVINNQLQQDQPSSEKQLMHRNTSFSFQSNYPTHNQTMNNDAIVISRSVINLDNHRHSHHNRFSSFRPNRSIIERNGKQFLTELNERLERRYVEVFDETAGRRRLFEVTDYIPSRIIQEIRPNSQFQSQNSISRNPLPPKFSSNPPPLPPPMSSNRREPLPPLSSSSNLVDFKGLNNPKTVAREFDLYHSGATLPYNNNNKNASHTTSSRPPLKTQESTDSNYTHPEPKPYNTSRIASKEVPNQYTSGSYRSQAVSRQSQPASFRPHSPTASDYSVTTTQSSNSKSDDTSDSEGVDRTLRSSNTRPVESNRNSSDVAYGTIGGNDSPTQLDPFKKQVNKRDPYYAKRPSINNYSEPIMTNRNFQKSAVSDYAPIPVTYNQSNRSRYSHRKDSSVYDG